MGAMRRAATPYIAVVGPGTTATEDDVRVAHAVGRALAQAGAVVLTGGHGGVMQAAAAGCAEAGGTSIGILPDRDRARANAASTYTIPTGMGELRNGLLVRAADAVICVAVSWGTLSEVALAVRTGVPVVALGGWAFPLEGPVPGATAGEAVDLALALAAAGQAAEHVEAAPAGPEPSSPQPAQRSPWGPEIPPSPRSSDALHGNSTQPRPHSQHAHSQHAHPPQPPVIHHLTLTVSDVDRSAAWYQALLGPAESIRRTGPGWQRIRMQWSSGLVIGVTAHEATPAGDAFDHGRVGLDHVGLSCRDETEVRLWARRLDEIGAIRGPVEDAPYGWAVTGRDPDSIPVEFFAPK
jgi:uncharacterized protein (TIGR00725 family)